MNPEARIRQALARALDRIPAETKLDGILSATQPVNELLRPVQQENSKAFAMMAVPDQMANSFLCQNRQRPEETAELKLPDAKYGNYYLSAARLNFGDEESPALLLLWAKEQSDWKIVAWAVEQP
jgi:hypothetical protein